MSLTVQYEQTPGRHAKALDFAGLQNLVALVCHVGSVGPNFSFSEAAVQPAENGECAYMMYGKREPLGRGFCLFVRPDYSQFRLVTPLPTTGHDLDDFFAVAGLLGRHLGQAEFLTEERQRFPVDGMDVFRNEMKSDNCMMVKDFADERPGFAVSGVKYPLHMAGCFCEQLAQMDPPAAEKAFSQLLAEKQKDYYYLNPNFYRNTDTGETIAIYALNEEVDSLIPKEPFIPYGEGPFGEETVGSWQVALIQNSAQPQVAGTLSYECFLAALHSDEKEDFDEMHYLLRGLSPARMRQLAGLADS